VTKDPASAGVTALSRGAPGAAANPGPAGLTTGGGIADAGPFAGQFPAAAAAYAHQYTGDALVREGIPYQYEVAGAEEASVDERYAPMHTGDQGRIDASMRPIEHEAASWTASEAFKILAESVPAQYQGDPNFGWAVSEVVRLAEERAKAKYGLPDHQTAAIKQYNVRFAGNLPPFHGYLLWRGDGQYTRLIPADTLPPLKGIPPTQTNKVGYWVCPPPTSASETGWSYQQQQTVELAVSYHRFAILPNQLTKRQDQYQFQRPASHQGVSGEDLQVSAITPFQLPVPRFAILYRCIIFFWIYTCKHHVDAYLASRVSALSSVSVMFICYALCLI